MKALIILSCIFSTSGSLASVPNVSQLRTKVESQSLEISKLAAKVRTVDKKISQTNDEYLQKMRKVEALEQTVSELKIKLNDSAAEISKEYKLVKKALDLYLLEMSSSEGYSGFSHPKLYLEILQTKIKDLKKAQESSDILLGSLNQFEQGLENTRRVEETLYQLIVDLENEKKDVGERYISLMEEHNAKQDLLDREMAKRKAKKKVYPKSKVTTTFVSLDLSMPISNFIDMKKGKKGVTFKYDEIVPLKSPASGKVAYAGDLASYGKVIMIDHGENIRSVFLGDMALKVKKDTLLQRGEIIGYTVSEPGLQKSLYYEVRLKNMAQDTYSWLAKNNKNLNI